MGHTPNKWRHDKVDSYKRSQRAVDLRVAGASWPTIANEAGYESPDAARMAVKRHFEKHATSAVEEMRPILQERAEYMWRQFVRRLATAETVDEWCKIMAQGDRVQAFNARINGLADRPPQINVAVQDRPDVQELQRRFIHLAGLDDHNTIDADPQPDDTAALPQ